MTTPAFQPSEPISITTYGSMKLSMHPTNNPPGYELEAESFGPIKILQGDSGIAARMPKGNEANKLETENKLPRKISDRKQMNIRSPSMKAVLKDQPVFTVKAHVFFIEPSGSKKEWTPAAQGAVPVNIYYDSPRQCYRIISIVDSKAIVNSALMPDYTFIKTSHKFGQWLDAGSGILYGLGFTNEPELTNFSRKFNQFKDDTTPPPPLTKSNRLSQRNGSENGYADEDYEEDVIVPDKTASDNLYSAVAPFRDQFSPPSNRSKEGGKPKPGRNNHYDSNDDLFPKGSEEAERLKTELEKSKNQLTQISKENKKKEDEIGTLKKNNQKLTNALKESAANVEEWKKLLHKYREESLEAKNKIADMEAQQREKEDHVRSTVQQDERLQELVKENQDKDREIAILNKELLTAQNDANRLQLENNRLKDQLRNTEEQLDRKTDGEARKRKENQDLALQMSGKIQELQILGATLQSKL